jgi:hypothetical protein
MSYKKNKYIVIKNAISKEIADLSYKYIILKRAVAKQLLDTKYIPPFSNYFGVWNDVQVPETYSHYSDILMETLLMEVKQVAEKNINLKLIPNYSYVRVYKNGDALHRHKDRFSCEISTTLNLGGDPWPIFIDPTGTDNIIDERKNIIKPNAPKGVKVILNSGDMLVYKGNELEHWREKFEGNICAQVFLHYNNSKTKGAKENMYDKRPHLGLPDYFKKK